MPFCYSGKKPVRITEEAMRAELLRLHNQDRWGGAISILESHMRRRLREAGWIECRRLRPDLNHGKLHWFVTKAGRAELVDIPGSGIYRSKTPASG